MKQKNGAARRALVQGDSFKNRRSHALHAAGLVFILGIGTIVAGMVIMLAYRLARPQFFLAGRNLPEALELAELARS